MSHVSTIYDRSFSFGVLLLACEDAYSKLVEVVTVVDVTDEDRVGNSLLHIQ